MNQKEEIEEARKVIAEGGLVIFPTETAYGIAADATSPEAVDKVYRAKQRPRSKGLTTIVSSLSQAEEYAELSEQEKKLAEKFMPGPLTLVAEKKENVPDNLNENFVFRISSSDLARQLASETPITATSANIAGEETSYSVEDISQELLEETDYVVDKGKLEQNPTSTIIELQENGELKVHREGPIKKQEIEKTLQR